MRGLVPGADLGSWSRFYQNDAAHCLTIDTVSMPAPVATPGDLCLINGGSITGAANSIDVGNRVFISGPVATGSVKYPATGAGWTNPTNVYSNNGVYATNVVAAAGIGSNQDSTNFSLGIPAGAQILGIKVQLERMASACCNAVQTITETGSPTSGTFVLKGTPPGGSSQHVGQHRVATRAPLTVQTALTASTMYGTGNVACTGGPLPTTAVACTFQGAYASMPVSTMTFTKTGFFPTAATPVITVTTVGSAGALSDHTVQLLKAGSPVGTNKATSSTMEHHLDHGHLRQRDRPLGHDLARLPT